MPFELGIDYGCRNFGRGILRQKRFLIMDAKRYRHTVALSDMAGCDIQTHSNDYLIAIRKVRNWLVTEAGARNGAAQQIANQYYAFQEWDYERQIALGASEEDIQDYPTSELMGSMKSWMELGQPPTY